VIRLEGVAVGGPRPALENASCAFGAGTIGALIGAHRSGKTTLLEVAIGLRVPRQGRVEVDGIVPGRNSLAIRRRVCFVPAQAPLLPRATVLTAARTMTSLAMGRLPSERETVHALRSVEVPDRLIRRGAHGLDPLHRVCVWLAVHRLRQTPILLLDEPSSLLNARDTAALGRLLRETIDTAKCCVFTARDSGLCVSAAAAPIYRIDGGRLRLAAPAHDSTGEFE
jgi:ABC-type multidrug transport system ATPase subunit